jgi:hypothetical protein
MSRLGTVAAGLGLTGDHRRSVIPSSTAIRSSRRCRKWPTARFEPSLSPFRARSVRDWADSSGQQWSAAVCQNGDLPGVLANAQLSGWPGLKSQCRGRRFESVHLHRSGLEPPTYSSRSVNCGKRDVMANPTFHPTTPFQGVPRRPSWCHRSSGMAIWRCGNATWWYRPGPGATGRLALSRWRHGFEPRWDCH